MDWLLRGFFVMILAMPSMPLNAESSTSGKPVLVIHGGAGTILKTTMTPELEKEYTVKLEESLRRGFEVLRKGGSSLDAVEMSVRVLEDSPLFNAGKGAVFTHDGKNELDAAIMDGRSGKAGSVAGVTTVKNPISAARAVMEKSSHVLLVGKGAERFARSIGLELVEPSYFWTKRRWDQLQKAIAAEKKSPNSKIKAELLPSVAPDDNKLGTVGAVALDTHGNLAAATSTGGTTNKRYGRVGDSPIIGAGTFASNSTCAVSATGHGEYFIRQVVAYDISALMEYKKLTVTEAANLVVNEKLKATGGEGGVIALDRSGNFAMPFNSEGMYRGYIRADGVPHVFIYRD